MVAGIVKGPSFVSTAEVLACFGSRLADARKKYKAFVRSGIKEDSPLDERTHHILLGSDSFVAEILSLYGQAPSSRRRPGAVARKKSLSSLFSQIENKTRVERNALICRAHFDHKYTLMDIGNHLGLHYTTVSKVINNK